MPIQNSSVELYSLGKGIVSMGEWVGSTPPPSLTDVGNSPAFEVEVTEETLEHVSSRAGVGKVDKTVTLQTGYTTTFTLDEISVENVAKFIRGSISGTNVVNANQKIGTEFALEFVSDNPIGLNSTWRFHKMTLAPNGAFPLIGETFAELAFTGTGLADEANNPTSPFFTVTFATTTTTTTTT